jgi:hypothetical protein
MPDGGSERRIEHGYNETVDQAAHVLAQSVTRGLAKRPLGLLYCTFVWLASLPLQAFTYLCGN